MLEESRFLDLLSTLKAGGFDVHFDQHAERLRRNRMVKLGFGNVSVDFVLGETEFDSIALDRSRRVTYLDIPLRVASAEDLILYKLIAHCAHDLGDIEKVIRRQ